jgi:TatA/E family protein of Tat protein translocase
MFGVGFQELMVILVIALLVFGPKKLPELARSMGKAFAEFRRASTELRQHLDINEPPPAPPPKKEAVAPPAPEPTPELAAPEPEKDLAAPRPDATTEPAARKPEASAMAEADETDEGAQQAEGERSS